jgi:hypothetical protein
MKVKLFLSIGYSGANHEDVIDIPDEDVKGMTDEELEKYLSNTWQEWANNFIDGTYSIMEEDSVIHI